MDGRGPLRGALPASRLAPRLHVCRGVEDTRIVVLSVGEQKTPRHTISRKAARFSSQGNLSRFALIDGTVRVERYILDFPFG